MIVRWDYCPKPNYYTYQATKTRRYNHTTTLLCGGPHIVSILMIDTTKSCLLRIALHPSPRVLPAGLRESQPCRYCFYSAVQKWGFRTAEATRCPDKREIWHGGADLPRAKFQVYRGRNVRIQPPKLSKFRILAINLLLGRLVCTVFTKLSAFVRVDG